jgi:hypothetical protein
MVCDHTWMMKMERTMIIIIMGHTMEEEAGIRWGSFITSERPGSSQPAQGNNTVLLCVPV